jgi:hypothetical protein
MPGLATEGEAPAEPTTGSDRDISYLETGYNVLKRKRDDGCVPNGSRSLREATRLADLICSELAAPPANDSLHECGQAVTSIVATNPDYALRLAKSRINSWEYRKVPSCWLRLYEDSILHRAAALLRQRDEHDADPASRIDEVVAVLDHAVITSGARGRPEIFVIIFERLQDPLHASVEGLPTQFPVVKPPALITKYTIQGICAPSLEAFQHHLDEHTSPLAIRDLIDHWPAMETWNKISHLLKHTLGGRRLVPVEIGKTYTDQNWRQQLMTVKEYIQKYVLPATPAEIGYMGQYDLFAQIPELRKDINIPDYCYTEPPLEVPESLLELPPATQLLEPQVNAWLGPKGTRSPLHHDPYHNIFCQVVGFKYVRLYPPAATKSMYPRDVDGKGISMSNTSSVDIQFDVDQTGNISVVDASMFPLFCEQDKYQEAILGPGQCLYIPAGWWHYFESLSISFSVSFWWN